jgi:hypothetical protein
MQTRQPAAPDAPPGPGPVTAFVQPLGIGLLVALAFVLIYLTAPHQPQPHNLPVGVLAPLQRETEDLLEARLPHRRASQRWVHRRVTVLALLSSELE